MNSAIPRLGKYAVIAGIEDHLPPYSASAKPVKSEHVIVLMMRMQNQSIQHRRQLRMNSTESYSGCETGFILSESQARELACRLLSEADNIAAHLRS